MKIAHRCPGCRRNYEFPEKCADKLVQCKACDAVFVVPAAEMIETSEADACEPLDGFYWAVFVGSWRVFARAGNLKFLVFIFAATASKFFLGHADFSATVPGFRLQMPIGQIITILAFGCVFWYYMRLIEDTAYGVDEMPESDDMDSGFSFFGNVIKANYTFIVAFLLSHMPLTLVLVTIKGMHLPAPAWLRVAFVLAGFFVFPMILLNLVASSSPWSVFMPANLVRPILRAFWPYSVTFALLAAGFFMQFAIPNYGKLENASDLTVAAAFAGELVAVTATLMAMRSVGLFGRHYDCYIPALTAE